ncbi:inhibitor of apoptosis repeat-containing protein [Terfezia boudieri ATCC MYA-4762]|uniref:Inhibitor of apoptosis repeat-containing protein n=1 Tax=Terfezia boudieri ATCC MYA-4762 TaxID=1051890 RepID=A0A3N4LFX0_9PEZI|nr:inhibitor of apoptosis repeat-containing protein [Terfezia boudieri ATCC MYA-4762]
MAASSSSIVVPDGMHIYQNRLATFSKALPRRRASNTAGKSSHSPLIWPHTSPSTEKLAKAGFYYRPTISAPDNACCYLCKKNLDGWEPDDIPAIEHAKHSLSCGWAIVHATEIRLQSSSKAAIEDPMSEGMVEARRMTFGKWWPHEKKKGWGPKVNKCSWRKQDSTMRLRPTRMILCNAHIASWDWTGGNRRMIH